MRVNVTVKCQLPNVFVGAESVEEVYLPSCPVFDQSPCVKCIVESTIYMLYNIFTRVCLTRSDRRQSPLYSRFGLYICAEAESVKFDPHAKVLRALLDFI